MIRVILAAALVFTALVTKAQTIDDALAGCPTAAEVVSIDAKLAIQFDYDGTGPTLVCATSAGSANLTEMKRRVYKFLLALPKLTSFGAVLPWTQLSYVDWLYTESGLKGIRFRSEKDITNSFCCDPPGVINLMVSFTLPYQDPFKDASPVWWDPFRGGFGSGLLTIITHEARHIRYGNHTCASQDNTIEEYGANGVQVALSKALADHADPAFFRPISPPAGASAAYYRDYERGYAEFLRQYRFCKDTTVLKTVTVTEFHNTILNHYFMTANQDEVSAILSGSAGPGWTLTGRSFKAWQSAATARLDAVPVCRFYGTPGRGPNSHFYTADESECAAVKRDPGWTFEGVAFYLVPPPLVGFTCDYARFAGGSLPEISRVYNNRFALNDSNHRFVADSTTYGQMIGSGWRGEGRVFCAAPN